MVLHMSEGTVEANGKNIFLHKTSGIYAEYFESGWSDRISEQGGEVQMGMTIAEKIIAAAAGVDSVKPGDIHTVKLDRLMSNDGTTHLRLICITIK